MCFCCGHSLSLILRNFRGRYSFPVFTIMPSFNWINIFRLVKRSLRGWRLSGSRSFVKFLDDAELGIYLASIRTWNSLTEQWNSNFSSCQHKSDVVQPVHSFRLPRYELSRRYSTPSCSIPPRTPTEPEFGQGHRSFSLADLSIRIAETQR